MCMYGLTVVVATVKITLISTSGYRTPVIGPRLYAQQSDSKKNPFRL